MFVIPYYPRIFSLPFEGAGASFWVDGIAPRPDHRARAWRARTAGRVRGRRLPGTLTRSKLGSSCYGAPGA